MRVKLERRAYLPHCTIGVLTYGAKTFVTMERPWRGNEPFESCIPEGKYTCKRVMSPKFGDTWEVTAVPRREAILFHAGNKSSDVQGCIALGTMLSEQEYAVLYSKKAIEEFLCDTKHLPEIELCVTHYVAPAAAP